MSQNQRRLTIPEIQTLHSEVAVFVQDYMRTNSNPDMAISPYEECDVGVEALSCPLNGVIALEFEHYDLVRGRFPGSSIYVEKMPNGSAKFALQISIWVEETIRKGVVRGGGGGGRMHTIYHPDEPSMTTGLFLFMCLVLDCTVLYFRLSTATIV